MERYKHLLDRVKALNAAGWALVTCGQGMGRRVETEFSFTFVYHTGSPSGEVCSDDLLDALESACERAEKIQSDWQHVESYRR